MYYRYYKLFSVSLLGLFLELALIRWFPAHVFTIGYFSNIILIASFLGSGIGLLISDRRRDFFNYFVHVLALAVLFVLLLNQAQVELPSDPQAWIWYYKEDRICGMPWFKLPVTLLIGFMFSLTALVFVPIGQRIGILMRGLNPLSAYTINIIGSITGVMVFWLISAFQLRACYWFLLISVFTLASAYRERLYFLKAGILLSIVLVVFFVEKNTIWSPYYAINYTVDSDKSVNVYVNQQYHQNAINFERNPKWGEKYSIPYRLFHPGKVLIVGAGTGNDVWAACNSGAEQIDAVEIDPVILSLGTRIHPQHPYDNRNIRVYIDDARSFISTASARYDMIVYGLLDSHAALNAVSSIRLDNYVYTMEALRTSRQLLADDGVTVLFFCVPTKWMMTRMIETIRAVFGTEYVRYMTIDRGNGTFEIMIIAGPGVSKLLYSNSSLTKHCRELPPRADVPLPTDDWPYLYLESRGMPNLYLVTLIILISISVASILIFTPYKVRKIDPIFFLLGSGFLLLEAKSVTTFSLLFGSTWIVNSIVFLSILLVVLAANILTMAKLLKNRTLWTFTGLIISLACLYFVNSSELLKMGIFSKSLTAGVLIGLPVFFSSSIFATAIERVKDAGQALGSNLLGAVLGGFLEYYSMIGGLNSLYVIAIICYVFAGLLLFRANRSA